MGDPHEFRRRLLIDTGTGLKLYEDAADDWQERDFAAMDSGWKRALGQNGDGYLRAYLERPRGHSKTTDIAIMACWALFASRRQIRGVVAAGDQEQAGFVRDAAQKLIKDNLWLGQILHSYQYRITNRYTGSVLQILASDAATNYGETPDFLVCDELTHWEKPDMWDAMFSSVAKRPLCMLLIISNAGIGEGSSWQWNIREMARMDESWYFSRIDGPTASWMSEDQLAEQRRMLPPSSYKRLYLNLWVPGSGDALDPADIQAAITLPGPARYRDYESLHIAGLDLGVNNDHTGFVTVAIRPGSGRIRLVECRSWKPQEFDGKVPLDAVKEAVKASAEKYGTAITYYDPHECELMAQQLRNEGVIMEEMPFIGKQLTGMASALLQVFTSRRIDLYRDEDLIRDLQRISIVEKPYGYKLEAVRDENGHADRATALAIVMPAALEAAECDVNHREEMVIGRIGG